MAIAFDAFTYGGATDPGTSHSFSHTCTGDDRILFVFIVTGGYDPTNDDLTSVTYNGVDMTLVAKNVVANVDRMTYLYMLTGPASGAHSVAITALNSHTIMAAAASYTGAAQSGQPDDFTPHVGSGGPPNTSLTTSVTTMADNCWVVLGENYFDFDTAHAVSPGTTRGSSFLYSFHDSDGPITPAGSYSMTTSNTGPGFAAGISHIMAAFKPVGAGGSSSIVRQMMQYG